jgi:protein-S-isoprenylcysteine O-methyltransferase Ste14
MRRNHNSGIMLSEVYMPEQRGHKGRNDLAGEHALSDIGQLVLFIIFIAVWILDSFVFSYSTFISDYVPLYVRVPLAIIILFFGGYFAKKSHDSVFGEIREQPSVIRKGVFGRLRHPMYLGALLLYLGFLVSTFSLMAAGIWVIIIIFYYFNSKHEEKLLVDKFGKDYQDYKKEVPMLIPRIWRKQSL